MMTSLRTIYISSTFKDLAQERQLVFQWLAKQSRLYTPKNSEAQSPALPLPTCFEDIEESDAVILLLGACYGSRTKNISGEERSYTHHEYRHALSKGKPCFVFQIEESKDWADVPLADTESRDAFWKEVQKKHAIKRVSSKNLIDELSTALNKYFINNQGFLPQPAPGEASLRHGCSDDPKTLDWGTVSAAVMILLQDSGAGEEKGQFNFDCELYIDAAASSGITNIPWTMQYQDLNLDVGPRQTQHFPDLGPYIALCFANAKEKLAQLKQQGIIQAYELHVEIFTSWLALHQDLDFGALDVSDPPSTHTSTMPKRALKKTLMRIPFLLRSLDRLSADEDTRNNLENSLEKQWSKFTKPSTTAIATCQCPYNQPQGEEENSEGPKQALYARLETYPAHLHLPPLPKNPAKQEEFFAEIIYSGIPLALWWRRIDEQSVPIRLKCCKLLLDRAKTSGADSNEPEPNHLQLPPALEIILESPGTRFDELARLRNTLYSIHQWIPDLVFLIDCPNRKPRKS